MQWRHNNRNAAANANNQITDKHVKSAVSCAMGSSEQQQNYENAAEFSTLRQMKYITKMDIRPIKVLKSSGALDLLLISVSRSVIKR